MDELEIVQAARNLIRLEDEVQSYMSHIEESKVESVFEEEFVGFTEDVEEWRKLIESDETKQRHKDMKQEVIYDNEIIKNASGFALGPVILYKKKTYEMVSSKAKSLEEIKELLKDKKYILYYIFHRINEYEVDDITFTFKKLESPQQVYTFRGCFLNKE